MTKEKNITKKTPAWKKRNANSIDGAVKANAFQYKDCGLDYIWLLNGFDRIDDPDFGVAVSIHDVEGLNKAIAIGIIKKVPFIRGQEVRFLRSQLKFNQSEMGNLVRHDMRTIQRWEEKRNEPIPADIDRFLRFFYTAYIGGKDNIAHKVCEYIKEAQSGVEAVKAEKDTQFPNRIELLDTGKEWKAA